MITPTITAHDVLEGIERLDWSVDFMITSHGVVELPAEWRVPIPEVYHMPDGDVAIDSGLGYEWYALTGYTYQWGYSGAVMHDSEGIHLPMARDMLTMSLEAEASGTPLVWVRVDVWDLENDRPDGWAVLYRPLKGCDR